MLSCTATVVTLFFANTSTVILSAVWYNDCGDLFGNASTVIKCTVWYINYSYLLASTSTVVLCAM